jgi:hypothetical protein
MAKADWSNAPKSIILFLLQFAPRKAISWVLAELRKGWDMDLIAVLGFVDSPWTRRELRQVVERPLVPEEVKEKEPEDEEEELEEDDDALAEEIEEYRLACHLPLPMHVAAALLALRESRDPETRQWATQEWHSRWTEAPNLKWFPTTLEHCCWNDTEALRLRAALEAEPSEEELRGEGWIFTAR